METLNTYLVSVARALVLSEEEKQHIKTSISTLRTRLNAWFGDDVKKQYQFGSSIREQFFLVEWIMGQILIT